MTVLLVLVTLSLFLLLERVAGRRQSPAVAAARRVLPQAVYSPTAIPAGFALARNHMWTKTENDGSVTIGLDGFLSRLVGVPEEVLLPAKEGVLTHDSPQIFLRQKDKALRLETPVAGRVAEINTEVLKDPGLLSKDPYGLGWLLRVRRIPTLDQSGKFLVPNPGQWLRDQIDSSIAFFQTRLGKPAIVTIQDGGVFTEGLLRGFSQGVWDEFNKTFATLQKKD